MHLWASPVLERALYSQLLLIITPDSSEMKHWWEGMKVAYVSQDQKLFANTIQENVAYGDSLSVSNSDVWEALKQNGQYQGVGVVFAQEHNQTSCYSTVRAWCVSGG